MEIIYEEGKRDVFNYPVWYRVLINGLPAGGIYKGEDGFFQYYAPLYDDGYIPSWVLRSLADKVDELNKPWQDEIDKLHAGIM